MCGVSVLGGVEECPGQKYDNYGYEQLKYLLKTSKVFLLCSQ